MFHPGLTLKTKHSSFPRKRESSFLNRLDSRFRGNDGTLRVWLKKFLFISLLLCLPLSAQARSHHSHNNNAALEPVTVAELPPEARDTLRLIKQGGPFPYPRDGVVFGNVEKRLPQQQRNYYHEHTVKTPGARNRGARRIVCGPLPECYYSGDHYRTFQRILK